MGVEDGRVLRARSPRHGGSSLFDVPGRGVQGPLERVPLGLRVLGRAGVPGDRLNSASQSSRRPDGDPGSCADPFQDGAGRRRLRRRCCFRRRRGDHDSRRGRFRAAGLGLAEALVGEAPDGGERLRRLRTLRPDDQLVSAPGTQRGDPGQASRDDRAPAVGGIGDRHGGVVACRGAHQQRRRPCVQTEGVAHGHPDGLDARRPGYGPRCPGPRRRGGEPLGLHECAVGGILLRRDRREVRRLGREAATGRDRDRLQRVAQRRRHARRHSALHQRGLGQQHPTAPLLLEQVDCQLGGEDGAAEVHEDQHAVVGPDVLDRRQHLRRIGAESAAGLVQPAGGAHAHLRPRHLRGELDHAFGESRAVADDDEADHRDQAAFAAPAAGAPPSVRAAASSSSHDDVAPGSWWPALRSPR